MSQRERTSADSLVTVLLEARSTFLNSLPKEIGRLAEYIDCQNEKDATLICHRLKGSASTCGFYSISDSFARVEARIKDNNLTSASLLINELEHLARTEAASPLPSEYLIDLIGEEAAGHILQVNK